MAMGQRCAARTPALGSRGICYLGIVVATWGLMAQLQAGAWMYSYAEQKDYTWEQAREYCQTYFTDLVAIQNKKEIEYLNEWLPFHPRYYWIGIRKLNGTWTWVGTRKALTKEAENWAEKEPNNKRSNQDCVEIYIKRQREPGKWNDEPCSKRKRALCYEASCQPQPCSQRGQCVETIGNYSCECRPGFHGRDCEHVVACPVLSAPERGELNCSHPHGNFSFGSTCSFSCQPGFVLMGTASSECTATGEWSEEPPTCEAIKCPPLVAPAMGHTTCSHLHGNFSFGSTCTFSCQRGFVLTGTRSSECTATGDWSEEAPTCEVIRCPSVAAPAMGHAACSHLHGNFSFGSTCSFSCQPGFVLTGTASSECTATGEWSEEPPTCEAAKCPLLSAPEWGELNCSHPHGNFSFGSTCSFSCHPGFVLMGTASSECTATGEWSEEPPTCEAIKCPMLVAPVMGHTTCSHPHGNFSFGSTCSFSCHSGFVLMGTASSECTAMGDWSEEAPTCEAIRCPSVAAPAMGHAVCSHLHGNFSFGSTCTFSCHPGFMLTGTVSSECTASGEWSGESPQCEAIKCSTLVAPAMGHTTCSHPHGNFSFGSTCSFSCHPGFVLTGTASSECMTTGEWSEEPPTCEATKCPLLSAPERGELNCSHPHGNFSFGSTCSFSCQPGFVLMGTASSECTATGEWSEEPPTCEAIKCPALVAPVMGHTACSHPHGNFSFNSTCSFSCQPGFMLTGTASSECTATGEWSEEAPTCEAIKCPTLVAPVMGHATCSHLHGNFSFGSTCSFSCQSGFVLMGTASSECTAMGEWSREPPQCEAIKCPALVAPVMGHTACSHPHGNFSFGSTCSFSCQSGFVLMGTVSSECTATGEWSREPPQCEAISCPALAAPSGGRLSCSHAHGNFSYNSTCVFSCAAGLVRRGAPALRCAPTGTWNARQPVCAEDGASFLKQALVYSGGAALAAVGMVLSGSLIVLLVKRLSDRDEKKKLLSPTSDLGSPGLFTNAAYDSNL